MKTKTAQHTPGPWNVEYNTDDFFEPDAEDIESRYVIGICGANGKTVYYTESGYFKPNPADVALIAAAPDLLAACEQAKREACEGETYKILCAAISKARGEA